MKRNVILLATAMMVAGWLPATAQDEEMPVPCALYLSGVEPHDGSRGDLENTR